MFFDRARIEWILIHRLHYQAHLRTLHLPCGGSGSSPCDLQQRPQRGVQRPTKASEIRPRVIGSCALDSLVPAVHFFSGCVRLLIGVWSTPGSRGACGALYRHRKASYGPQEWTNYSVPSSPGGNGSHDVLGCPIRLMEIDRISHSKGNLVNLERSN